MRDKKGLDPQIEPYLDRQKREQEIMGERETPSPNYDLDLFDEGSQEAVQRPKRRGCLLFVVGTLILALVAVAFYGINEIQYEEVVVDESVTPDLRFDLSPVFDTSTDWYDGLKRLEVLTSDIENLKSSDWKDRKVFLNLLRKRENLYRLMDNLEIYANLISDTDFDNNTAADMVEQFLSIQTDVLERLAFIDEKATKIPLKLLSDWKASDDFSPYAPELEFWIEYYEYGFDETDEALIAGAQRLFTLPESVYEAYTYLTEIEEPDLYYEDFIDPDKSVRVTAYTDLYYKSRVGAELLATALEGDVLNNLFIVKMYHLTDAFSADLDADGIDTASFEYFEKEVKKGLVQLHRWKALEKKLVGLEEDEPLQIYDMYLPYVMEDMALSGTIDFDEAKEMVMASMAVYGEAYTSAYRAFLNENHLDISPRESKVDGAYTWGTYDNMPYTVMNYYGDFEDMLTLTHESGHVMHQELSRRAQAYSEYDPSVLISEMAATTNEAVLFEWILNHPESFSQESREAVLVEYAKSIEDTIYMQLMASEFQRRIYADAAVGTNLDADHLNGLWQALVQEYYGPAYRADEIDGLGWTDMQHLYWGFYVHKYAIGYCAGIANAQNLGNDLSFSDQYVQLLTEGSSRYASEQLESLGYGKSGELAVPIMLERFEEILDEIEADINTL